MNQQEIVWVKLPFSNLKETKVRPAIIISNNDYNQESKDAVVCALTSNLDKSKYSIIIEDKDISEGKLPLKSRIRADKILQIENNLIIRPFAKLNSKTFDKLIKKIIELIQRY